MSYRRAWLLVDTMNRCFRGPVVEAGAGGKRGGGARLTPLGPKYVLPYRASRSESREGRLRRGSSTWFGRLTAALSRASNPDGATPSLGSRWPRRSRGPPPRLPRDLVVAAAASLASPMEQIGREFEAAHPGTRVRLEFGASDTLVTGSPRRDDRRASSPRRRRAGPHRADAAAGHAARRRRQSARADRAAAAGGARACGASRSRQARTSASPWPTHRADPPGATRRPRSSARNCGRR